MATKAELEQKLKEREAYISGLEKYVSDLENRLKASKQDVEEAFRETQTYRSMQGRIAELGHELDFYKTYSSTLERGNEILKGKLARKSVRVADDSKASCEPEIGRLTEELAKNNQKLNHMRKRLKNAELLLEGGNISSLNDYIPVVGHPTVGSAAEEKEARRFRREGYSVREIAAIMGWSTGKTHKTVSSVSVDPEVRKQHRANNRRKKGKK